MCHLSFAIIEMSTSARPLVLCTSVLQSTVTTSYVTLATPSGSH